MKLTLDNKMLQTMQLFEKITRAKLKSCFEDNFNNLVFVVDQGQIQRALGKGMCNLDKLKSVFVSKKLRIIEYNSDVKMFIKNVVRPVKLAQVTSEVGASGTIYVMAAKDIKDRGLLIGRNAQNLRNSEFLVKQFFELVELKVTVTEQTPQSGEQKQ